MSTSPSRALICVVLLPVLPVAGCIGGSGSGSGAPSADGSPTTGNATPTDDGSADPVATEHVHDRWEGRETVTLLDADVETGGLTDIGAERSLAGNVICALQCSAVEIFTPAEERIVPPGTDRVVVEISRPSGTVPQTVMDADPWLAYQAADMTGFRSVDPERVEGSNPRTFAVNTTVEMADGGHAKASLWRFALFVDSSVGNADGTTVLNMPRWMQTSTTFHVTATAHRVEGELPREPPHPEFWADGPRRTVWTSGGAGESAGTGWVSGGVTLDGDPPYGYANGSEHEIVPPGTKLLTMEINWTNDSPTGDAAGVEPEAGYYYGLSEADVRYERWETVVTEPGHAIFRVAVPPDETDGIYAERSRWRFRYMLWGQDTGVDEPTFGFDVTAPYHLDGSWNVTLHAWSRSELPVRYG